MAPDHFKNRMAIKIGNNRAQGLLNNAIRPILRVIHRPHSERSEKDKEYKEKIDYIIEKDLL